MEFICSPLIKLLHDIKTDRKNKHKKIKHKKRKIPPWQIWHKWTYFKTKFKNRMLYIFNILLWEYKDQPICKNILLITNLQNRVEKIITLCSREITFIPEN